MFYTCYEVMEKIVKKFLILTFLLVPSLAFASQKVFYDSQSKLQITDVSAKKTKEQIVKEFNLGNINSIQELTIDEPQEAARLNREGTLVKYNFVLENQKEAAVKKKDKVSKESFLKKKLGLTDSEWSDLKEVLGNVNH